MLWAMMEIQHKLMSEASEDLRREEFQEIRDLNERIEGVVEGKEEYRKVEEWRDALVAVSRVTRLAAVGSPKRRNGG